MLFLFYQQKPGWGDQSGLRRVIKDVTGSGAPALGNVFVIVFVVRDRIKNQTTNHTRLQNRAN